MQLDRDHVWAIAFGVAAAAGILVGFLLGFMLGMVVKRCKRAAQRKRRAAQKKQFGPSSVGTSSMPDIPDSVEQLAGMPDIPDMLANAIPSWDSEVGLGMSPNGSWGSSRASKRDYQDFDDRRAELLQNEVDPESTVPYLSATTGRPPYQRHQTGYGKGGVKRMLSDSDSSAWSGATSSGQDTSFPTSSNVSSVIFMDSSHRVAMNADVAPYLDEQESVAGSDIRPWRDW